MNAKRRREVVRRAGDRCEYCQMPQELDELPHHVDHIVARKHEGTDEESNLCLACANCSLGKGSNISGLDPRSGEMTRLFHPRADTWKTHFRWKSAELIGRTAIGRTTVAVLNINRRSRIALREVLIETGEFPPTR